jgi:hypothetical protein
MPDTNIKEAVRLMAAFAQRTGLTSDRRQQRYLWTDAFAVCNFLGLARLTGEQRHLELALRLVDQTHHMLGRHRDDDPRDGWISGLSAAEAEAHPTRGGLRIGKALPERAPGEPFDERLEWERDGQYFHYLTKWMHALDQVSRATGDPGFNRWARELAAAAHKAFTSLPAAGGAPRMYWKMSIDLSCPLVASMGQHDPLDGYITIMQLRAAPAVLAEGVSGAELEEAARQFESMLAGVELASPDPLGIGGLLCDAHRVAQLTRRRAMPDDGLLERLLHGALTGLQYYARGGELQKPVDYRLGFRELGLAIGMQAVRRIRQEAGQGRVVFSAKARALLEALLRYGPLGDDIESFWRHPEHQHARTWTEHRDINAVMLATCLAPDGFLVL